MENTKLKNFEEYFNKNMKKTADVKETQQNAGGSRKSSFVKSKKQNDNKQNNTKQNNQQKNKKQMKNPDKLAHNNQNHQKVDKVHTNPHTNDKNMSFTERMTARNRKFLENYNPRKNAKVKIIPLGGLNAIGMNITVIEDENDIVVIDCGNAFPSEDLFGVDLVIPDVSYLKKNQNKIRGMVLTHGHEDHIGAIPYILKELNMPIYGTKLTLALVEGKLKEHDIVGYKLNTVNFSDVIKLGNIYVEFIKTNHSIADSAALAIYTKAGIIMHTGDFKIDYTPVFGDSIDLPHFAEIGRMGVLALLSDSTNATKQGFTMSEKTVGKIFDSIFNEYDHNRIIVSTFASNVDRVQQIINTATKYGRKVVIEGRSMINIINIATELGYIDVPKGTLINVDMLKNYPEAKTVIITTGSQGESMAALSRMAQGTHKKVTIKKDDVVILSSSPIPGNEKAINKIIDELYRRHATVIYQDTHVSGHACAEELKLIYTLVGPRYAIPIHGEYRHRREAADIAHAVGVDKDKCLLLEIGDVLEICEDEAKVVDHIQANGINVDGLGVGDVGNIVLKDRQALATSGIVIISIALDKASSSIVSGPDIISKGFVYMKESGELIDGLKEVVKETIDDFRKDDSGDWKKLKSMIATSADKYLWKKIEREPLIVPIIIDV